MRRQEATSTLMKGDKTAAYEAYTSRLWSLLLIIDSRVGPVLELKLKSGDRLQVKRFRITQVKIALARIALRERLDEKVFSYFFFHLVVWLWSF